MPRKLFFRLKDGFPRVKLCFCVLCVLTYLALIRVSGAKLWGLFVFFLCAAVYLYLPGRFWARVTGMEKVLPEFAVPLGVLLGTGFLAVLYCVSMRLGVLWLLRALPPRITVVVSDPFYPDPALPPRSARRALHESVYSFLCDTVSERRSYAHIEYLPAQGQNPAAR